MQDRKARDKEGWLALMKTKRVIIDKKQLRGDNV